MQEIVDRFSKLEDMLIVLKLTSAAMEGEIENYKKDAINKKNYKQAVKAIAAYEKAKVDINTAEATLQDLLENLTLKPETDREFK